MADMVDAMIEEGHQAIDALPEHAKRISGLLTTHFPAQTLEAVHTAMRPEGTSGSVNQKVAELSSLVREEAAVAAAQLRACEMWLRLKAPAVSDGNNFGVDVQNYVLSELTAMRAAIDPMLVCGRDYYWTRGTGLDKILVNQTSTVTSMENTQTDTEDGKKVEKSELSQTKETVQETKVPLPDYTEYVVCVDVRQYHQVFNYLTDLRNSYLRALVLFEKNMKKLTDPRGDGDGKTAHSMSMF